VITYTRLTTLLRHNRFASDLLRFRDSGLQDRGNRLIIMMLSNLSDPLPRIEYGSVYTVGILMCTAIVEFPQRRRLSSVRLRDLRIVKRGYFIIKAHKDSYYDNKRSYVAKPAPLDVYIVDFVTSMCM
jgi:hypothetical protein